MALRNGCHHGLCFPSCLAFRPLLLPLYLNPNPFSWTPALLRCCDRTRRGTVPPVTSVPSVLHASRSQGGPCIFRLLLTLSTYQPCKPHVPCPPQPLNKWGSGFSLTPHRVYTHVFTLPECSLTPHTWRGPRSSRPPETVRHTVAAAAVSTRSLLYARHCRGVNSLHLA